MKKGRPHEKGKPPIAQTRQHRIGWREPSQEKPKEIAEGREGFATSVIGGGGGGLAALRLKGTRLCLGRRCHGHSQTSDREK